MTVKHDSMYTMRINKEIKEKAEIVARQSGLSLSGVVKALFIQMSETGAIPFDIRLTQNVRYHAAMDTSHMTHDEIIDKAMKEVINENIETLKVLAK
ncbi:MAG: type II toxin-antitoxin system RelB/DinJ family antitoxin [Solobacterium sp.]|nr:type II toxin-antitoxin system RelB/DinJ family antitoxin [Solobacterium sp.]MBR3141837.1 type II toxin-antitoxin system RelB/DinJ family antitoxin [Clostridiales bacterium]